ncbi:MAG TPA: hypothetical protein VFL59_14435 [Candidatus Nanopelagicales bacterium]|nr:hypothetical protein [Candidatus Nanopelagicales bacterium]
MRRTRIVSAAVALATVSIVAVASIAPAGAARAHRPRATIDRTTSTIGTTEAFFGDPVPVPYVNVSGTVRGCVPDTYVYAWISLTQDGIAMSSTGALGEGEYICPASGVLRVSTLAWSFTVPHAGRAKAVLHARGDNGLKIDLRRWVTIPG